MKYHLLPYLFAFVCTPVLIAQTTRIKDPNFERELINLRHDTGSPDGLIPTVNIKDIKKLRITLGGITNLSGIEDFTALKELNCSNNKLEFLDLSKNGNLTELDCANNLLKVLDLSKNADLEKLTCNSNELEVLNLKNGNNSFLERVNTRRNTNLGCIQVDNAVAATEKKGSYRSWRKGDTVVYSENCEETQSPYTSIPDTEFEKILSQYDDVLNDQRIPTRNINIVKELDIKSNKITDLTGLEGFIALEKLTVNSFSVADIPLSSLTKLKSLNITFTEISNLDLSSNTILESIIIGINNQLVSIDLSQNNFITSMSIQGNSALTMINAKNIKNHPHPFLNIFFLASNNPNLRCILVDNPENAKNKIGFYENWRKDDQAVYVEDCNTLGSYDFIEDSEVLLYPNPSNGIFTLSGKTHIDEIAVYSIDGPLSKIIKLQNHSSANRTIDLSTFPKGVYFIKIISPKGSLLKKIVIQ